MRWLLVAVLAMVAVTTVQAYDVDLGWDCTGSCTTALGFNLYQRQSTDCSDVTQFSLMDIVIKGEDRRVTVTGLQPRLTYCWYIKAYNEGGESGPSNTLVFQVPVQAPGAATGLQVIGRRQGLVPNEIPRGIVPFWSNNDGTVTVQPKR